MRFLKAFAVMLLVVVAALPAAAQDKIDKVLADLERKDDVTTTYSERRTRKKHKLYRITSVLTFTNKAYYQRLEKAFEDERANAVSAIKNNGARNYRFKGNKTESSYSLSHNNGKYTVSKSWRDTSVSEGDDASDNSNVRIIYNGDEILVSDAALLNGIDSENVREWAREQREWAARQREYAANQREYAEKQREYAAKQREYAEKQREYAAKQREKCVNTGQSTSKSTTKKRRKGNRSVSSSSKSESTISIACK
ncbi:MAG: DUF5024 domain-containing protein [Muribaculaceae bacterium]|nr:DUF5024 domain-containing protein [Muribaculaceae bacterium]